MPDINDAFGFVVGSEMREQGRSFDIDNWSKEFEDCFPKAMKLNPLYRDGFWGRPYGERPRLKEHNTESDAIATEGYRIIEFFPNRDVEDESYMLFGTPSEIRIQVVLLMALRMMQEHGGGSEWVGYPVNEWLKAAAGTSLSAQVVLLPNRQGINYANDPYWSKRQISIPHPDRRRLTYDALRMACGGKTGLNWGEWQCRAYMISPDGATQHQMVAAGPSQAQAQANLSRFLPFSKCTPKNYTYNQLDYNRGERAKDPLRSRRVNLDIYPAWLWIFNREAAPAEGAGLGNPTHTGKLKSKKFKLPLTAEKVPNGWSDRLTDSFRDRFGRLAD